MEETTAAAVDTGFSITPDDVNNAFDKILEVFGFFRKIIDAIKSVLTPLISGLIDSVLAKE